MGNFFKSIGKGIFNILIIPVFIVGLAISAVIGIFVFLFELIKKIGMFFAGKTLSSDLPEDIEAKRMIEEAKTKVEDPIPQPVEVVQAELATPPSVDYNELPPSYSEMKSISSNEDVDFLIDDTPLEIDAPVIPQVEEKEPEIEETDTYEPRKGEF
ncbi:MAG: hypothetical protein MJZ37_04850 [Bacilli bacterium]|nr:hypothetical protein [Bacilli bacterium]